MTSTQTPDAVILAAGFGSRLARREGDLKPLRPVGGMSLISRNVSLLASAGVRRVVVVVGYRADALVAGVRRECAHIDVELVFVENTEYDKHNGVSVLASKSGVRTDRFVLLMADHIFARSIIEQATSLEVPDDGAVLLIDRKTDSVHDIDDATKVETAGPRIVKISKYLETYDALDTGIFVCSLALYDALAIAREHSSKDDCSLSEGVMALLSRGTMLVSDIGDAAWEDVDTEGALRRAEALLAAGELEYLDGGPRRASGVEAAL